MDNPSDDPCDDRLPLATWQWIDEICLRFEGLLQAGGTPRIEDELADWQGHERHVLLRELLLLEVDYRSRSHKSVTDAEYLERFPDAAEIVQSVLAQGRAMLPIEKAHPPVPNEGLK